MFSEILLPFTNPDWLEEIREGGIGLSMVLTILEIILLVKLLRLIGLNSVNLFGLLTLGIMTIQEWEKYLGIIYPQKKALTTPIRSSLIIFQHF